MCNTTVTTLAKKTVWCLPRGAGGDASCVQCGGKLVQRSDDTEDVVKNRLNVYNEETFPLIQHYEAQHMLLHFDVKTGVGDIPELTAQVEKWLKK